MPENFQKIIFKEIKINNIKISPKEEYEYLKIISSLKKDDKPNKIYKKIDKMPKKIQEIVKPKMNIDKIKQISILLIMLYLTSALFNFTQQIIMATLSNKFANNLRKRISIKINKLPLKYFDLHQSGDILSRVTNDVDTIAQTMNQSLASLVSSITLFLGSLTMMFITNWIMALTAIGTTIIGFMGMIFILSKSQKYFKQRQEELGNLNGHIEEIYSGLNIVKAYNGDEEADKKFNEYNKKVCESNKKSQFISGLMQPLMGFIGNFGYVAVCIVGAILTMNDVITFGVIVAFMTYIRLFTQPLSQIAQGMTSLQSASAASERVFEFLDETEMKNESNIKTYLEKEKVKGNIKFENVSFKYDGNEKNTINNFTAEAKQGQKIAIVGPTGAGKTTMVNLLMKFYEITEGDIKIDNISTKELSRENIHELFTMVLQDTWIFDGTIKDNIIFNRNNISDDEIKKICKEVGLDHFIKTLSKGYDTILSDNESISAGQKQLLTIARGMTENSPFLILDEATSNVDTRTEELVAKAMDKLAKGKTSFIIAHRLSTIKNADLILVMDKGNIIEQGTHDELISKNGFYKKLYNSQFEK
ncbi:MAG: ABC transporter ATP-binding protein [Bacilli bacterium]|nr:ABC transporter ATP-binding protein [Bacilli bacterium]